MKILFFLGHDGHLRNFEAGINELVERGHTVTIALSQRRSPLMTASPSLDALVAEHPSVSYELVPKDKSNRHAPLLEQLGAARVYLRFLRPEYDGALDLRDRGRRHASKRFVALLRRRFLRSRAARALLDRTLRGAIHALPPSALLTEFIRDRKPDVVLFTPLVGFGIGQQAILRAARAAGTPTALLVHSWDNLTNKGVLHEQPDRVLVWNERQRDEAVTFQGVRRKDVVVTGAHSYDSWFDTSPSTTRAEFCERAGLDPARPFVLYVGSSSFIAADEAEFAAGWLRKLRQAEDPIIREAGVLFRPHPQNTAGWQHTSLHEPGRAAVWRAAELSGPQARRDYFDSIHHASAIVGINTSALIESAIQSKPVLTLLAPEFAGTQGGTLHFDHLVGADGFLQVAHDWDEHLAQLGAALADPEAATVRADRFVASYLRPEGRENAAAPSLADAVEQVAAVRPRRRLPVARAGAIAIAPVAAVALAPLALRAERAKVRRKADRPPKSKKSGKSSTLRVLFFMRAINYDRLFESTLRELLSRGYDVQAVFDIEKKGKAGDSPIFAALAKRYPNLSIGTIPALPETAWSEFGSKLRFAIDYLRYLEPRFADAPALRRRASDRAPWFIVRASRWPLIRTRPGRRALAAVLGLFEAAVPVPRELVAWIRKQEPSVVLVTPLVGLGSDQGDYIRAARRLGIPTAVPIASWDNLTNKGVIRDVPDVTFVWNDAQIREAVELHGIPRAQVNATGAHTYDQWFEWRPSTTREEFCAKVGLDPAKPFVLYVCSSRFIAPEEALWVQDWRKRLHASGDQRVRDVGVLVRPHPANAALWEHVDIAEPQRTVVFPMAGATPTTDEHKRNYYDSIYHCAAVVGINTSALIESAIIGRPVFTLLAPEFRETQEGTLHFAHLTGSDGDGILTVAREWDEHERQLSAAIADGDSHRDRAITFVESFVRTPAGGRSTTRLVDAIEQLALAKPKPSADRARQLLAALLAPFVYGIPALAVVPTHLGFRSRRPLRTKAPALSQKLRILFVIEHPGLLIHFDETVGSLLTRGHTVFLAFARPQKSSRSLKFAYALESLMTAQHRLKVVREIPHRSDWYTRTSVRVRAAADYLHYLDPGLAGASYSRAKWREIAWLPWPFSMLRRRETLPRWLSRTLLRAMSIFENSIPSAAEVERLMQKLDPDLVIVSPLVDRRPPQTDYVKSARALGVPSAVLVTSWDNLTSKGLIRLVPDRVVVWNERQRQEASNLHGIDPNRIVATGAQQFDRWFDRAPSSSREEFTARMGLPPDRPFALFIGSTDQGQPPESEPQIVRSWVTALRASDDPMLRNLSVLVRPHPVNVTGWEEDDLRDLEGVTVWMRKNLLPVQTDDRAEYFDAIHHSAAVMGINSSAMIEAAIVGRPVHTIALPELRAMQRDLIHFHYLLPEQGGFLREATSIEEHLELLAADLRDFTAGREEQLRFVESFLRPAGLDQPATPALIDAVEAAALLRPATAPERKLRYYPLRGILAGFALLARTHVTYHRTIDAAAWKVNRQLRQRVKRVEKGADAPARVTRQLAALANGTQARSQRWLKDHEEARKAVMLGGLPTESERRRERDDEDDDDTIKGAWSSPEQANGENGGKQAKPKKPAKQTKATKKADAKKAEESRWRDLLDAPRR